jgi:prepilin-type N-terminal cleavage/methylation domain-containing protein
MHGSRHPLFLRGSGTRIRSMVRFALNSGARDCLFGTGLSERRVKQKESFMKNTLKRPSRQQGFTLIELMIVIAVIALIIGAATYAFRSAQIQGHETATIKALDTIGVVQLQYFNTHNRNFGTFEQLVKDGLLDTRFSGNPPVVDGYVYTLKVTPKTANQQSSYTLNADPQQSEGIGASGLNHYYIDSTAGTKHVNDTQPAGPNDPPIGG